MLISKAIGESFKDELSARERTKLVSASCSPASLAVLSPVLLLRAGETSRAGPPRLLGAEIQHKPALF